MGVVFAFIALFAWGFGDFFVEKSTRAFGDTKTLFYVTAFGSIVLLPFVWKVIPTLWNGSGFYILLVLIITILVTTAAALTDYEALRIGKIAVVEPIYVLEIFITAAVASVILRESPTWTQLSLMILVVVGIALVSSKSFLNVKKFTWEKGVIFAFIAAVLMGFTNTLTGASARLAGALLANWVIYFGIWLVMFFFLLARGELKTTVRMVLKNPRPALLVSSFDTVAWVAFASSAVLIPVALTTAISEGYVALAALLGLVVNKEKLKKHQLLGIAVTVVGAVALAYFS